MATETFSSYNNQEYIEEISELPCIVCYFDKTLNGEVSDPHHESLSFKFKDYKRKNDYTALPVCHPHHQERHKLGQNEFWRKHTGKTDTPFFIALQLMLNFSKNTGLVLPEKLQKVLTTQEYFDYSEYKLRMLIDALSHVIHYQYTTGKPIDKHYTYLQRENLT